MGASDVVHLPTSLAQQRFWFLQSLEPKSPVFNVHVGLRLDGDFDETALCSALQDLVDRHESLRTAIVSDGGVPVQRVYAQMQVPVAARDLTNLSASDREEAMRDAVCAQASTPFDLS